MATYFYSFNIESRVTACDYLEKAAQHLEELTKTPSGWVTHGVKYARVMALLGKPTDSVKEKFEKAITVCENDFYRIRAMVQLGCYYLARDSYEQAKSQFQAAIDINREDGCSKEVAKPGLQLINELSQH